MLIDSAVIANPTVVDNGTFGGAYLSRVALTAGTETFAAYLSGTAEVADGLLCLLGKHPPLPVSADTTLFVLFEDAATALLYFVFS